MKYWIGCIISLAVGSMAWGDSQESREEKKSALQPYFGLGIIQNRITLNKVLSTLLAENIDIEKTHYNKPGSIFFGGLRVHEFLGIEGGASSTHRYKQALISGDTLSIKSKNAYAGVKVFLPKDDTIDWVAEIALAYHDVLIELGEEKIGKIITLSPQYGIGVEYHLEDNISASAKIIRQKIGKSSELVSHSTSIGAEVMYSFF